MILLIMLLNLLLMNCVTSFDDAATEKSAAKDLVINANSFEQDVRQGLALSITLPDNKMTMTSLKKHIFISPAPQHECLPKDTMIQKLPLLLSRTSTSIKVSTTHSLTGQELYGFYVRDEEKGGFCLRYVFRARASPKILSHDLGLGSVMHVPANRRRLRITFDQPIFLYDDRAVHFKSADREYRDPVVDQIEVDRDRKTLWVYLRPGELIQGGRYHLGFTGGLTNNLGWPTKEGFIDIIVTGNKKEVKIKEPHFEIATHKVEIFWPFDTEQRLDVFVKENGAEEYFGSTTIIDALYRYTAPIIKDLRAMSEYAYVLRAEDAYGLAVLARGTFVTPREHGLRITEILADPKIEGDNQNVGEYIEIANFGSSMSLVSLVLRIEDPLTHKASSCRLEKNVILNQGQYAVIVSSEWRPDLFGVEENERVIRLANKSLCQGLPNRSQKNIKIFDENGFLLDQFSNYGQPKKNWAIIRERAEGLDDTHNYCYRAPTPGKENDSCG